MYVGKVIGNVVATVKDSSLTGVKLLVVQLLDDDGNATGDPIVAADAIGISGEGDVVYLAFKREAALALPPPHGPIDAAIAGFIDEYRIVDNKEKYQARTEKVKPQPKKKPRQKAERAIPPDRQEEEEE